MRKRSSTLFFYFMAALFLISFTIQPIQAQTRRPVDNFLVLFDASESMSESYKGTPKVELAKNFVSRMNQALPDISTNSALRSFGLTKAFSFGNTSIISPLGPYSKKSFEDAVQSINRAAGQSPMAEGINASSDDLKAAQGKIALIIVSDWDELGTAPIEAAEKIKSTYGDRICIYPVMVGKNVEGLKLMEKIATAGQCGYATQAEQVEDMGQFDDKVFYTTAAAPVIGDSDNDGVLDNLDKCPDTPAGAAVDKDGCPLDSDKDGVYDYLDKCPGTPEGVKVDKDGCPTQVSMTLKIEFDTAKSDIKAKYHNEIKNVADFMKKYPQANTVIEGHTDNVGNEAANVKLSQSRANSVRTYLIEKFGVEKERLQAVGYGPKKPIASNATAEGKQKNRRVQAVITTTDTK